MTEPDDNTNTRPISVAELLAKNGTIGAPPVGGRRRRRRGNSDAVTVAELTGEIPIIHDDGETSHRAATHAPVRERPAETVAAGADAEAVESVTNGVAPVVETEAEVLEESPIAMELPEDPTTETPDDAATDDAPTADAVPESEARAPVLSEAEADYAAHLEQRDVDPDPLDFAPRTRRPKVSSPTSFAGSTGFDAATGGAEQMSPDPVIDDDEVDLGPDVDFSDVLDKHAAGGDDAAALDRDVPSYLRSGADTLFGGQSVADDLARRGVTPGPEDIDLGDEQATRSNARATAPQDSGTDDSGTQEGSAFIRGVWVVAQCILAVAFGAGLFIAFDQLWRWNTIVALVLSVLVILGLVVGVRVVRKTEDIGSTLIAVAVGALVTLGPLALLQSH